MDMQIQASFSSIFNELNKFRKEKKYCDINITVEGQSFACHRAILAASCRYFDVLFNSEFEESTKPDIPLKEMDAEAFEEILEFIYTGKVYVTPANAYRLLTNSHFFGLQYVEDVCVEYIDNDLPVDNLLEICVFIMLIKRESIQRKILEHVAENFVFISLYESFVDIPYDALESVLAAVKVRNETSSTIVEGDEILRAIMNWVKKDVDGRQKYVRRLLEFVPLRTSYRDILEELLTGSLVDVAQYQDCASTSKGRTHGTESGIFRARRDLAEKSNCSEPTVNVYVKEVNTRTLNVFSNVHLLTFCSKNLTWIWQKNCCSLVSNFKTLVVLRRQYFLVHAENRGNLFWCVDEQGCKVPLTPPPETTFNYNLTSINNVIYMHDIGISIQKESKIYAYMCETDLWLLISQDQHIPRNAAVTSFSDKLYIVGGVGADPRILGFDQRTDCWFSKPNSYRICNAAACVYERKIYVSGGGSTRLKAFDLVMDKWVDLENMKISRINHTLIPFKTRLWAIGTETNAEIYDPEIHRWSKVLVIPQEVQTNDEIIKVNIVKDAVIL